MRDLPGRPRVLPLLLALAALPAPAGEPARPAAAPFAIEVVDEATGRGVPMVELETTSRARYHTDSNGLVAFDEPGLMGRRVWFAVASHGYEFPADGFGMRGTALDVRPGGKATLKIKRINIAERLYRMTGQGIYRDTVLLGRTPPIAEPLLNGEVTGQDGILTAVYRGKVHWFWGDTAKLSYAMGIFRMTGATSAGPDRLDPDRGIDLEYFAGKDGAARAMVEMEGEGIVWLYGVAAVPDGEGRERMAAQFIRLKSMTEIIERGFVLWDDGKEVFEKVRTVPVAPPIVPGQYPFPVADGGRRYLYFPSPYPAVRVPAGLGSYLDLSAYEAYTPIETGGRYEGAGKTRLDRDAAGKLVWAWRKGTSLLDPRQQQELVEAGMMRRDESPHRLQDADGGKAILLHNASCSWNEYRKKYVLIASEIGGATMLGEVWYAESDRPEGPWVSARKIITHANEKDDAHDFYNPTQHPYLDRGGGRWIYLAGSYVNTFSGNPHPTPYYEYNQVLYRLDLADPRLRMP